MTFGEWLVQEFPEQFVPVSTVETLMRAWGAAKQAERERIKQIIEEVSWKGDHDKWFDCVDAIAERIEECSK